MVPVAVRIAFIGCGGAGSAHRRNVAAIADAQIVAVSDIDPRRATSAGNEHGCPSFTDWREMLGSVQAHAVYVAVPPTEHGPVERAVLEMGAALYVEKPLALNKRIPAQISHVIAERGAIATAGYQLRYAASTDAVRGWLQERRVGMINAFYYTSLPPTPWWRDTSLSGGQTVEQTTHMIDLIRYLGGEVAEITSRSALRLLADTPGMKTDDVAAHLMRLEGGAIATLVQTCALTNHGGMGLEIIAGGDLIHWRPERAVLLSKGEETVVRDAADPMATADRAFVTAVATRDPSMLRCTYDDARATLAVTLDAARSRRGEGAAPNRE